MPKLIATSFLGLLVLATANSCDHPKPIDGASNSPINCINIAAKKGGFDVFDKKNRRLIYLNNINELISVGINQENKLDATVLATPPIDKLIGIVNNNEGILSFSQKRLELAWFPELGPVQFPGFSSLYLVDFAWIESLNRYVVIRPVASPPQSPEKYDLFSLEVKESTGYLTKIGKFSVADQNFLEFYVGAHVRLHSCVSNETYLAASTASGSGFVYIFDLSRTGVGVPAMKPIELRLDSWIDFDLAGFDAHTDETGYIEIDIFSENRAILVGKVCDGRNSYSEDSRQCTLFAMVVDLVSGKILTVSTFKDSSGDAIESRFIRCVSGNEFERRGFLLIFSTEVAYYEFADGQIRKVSSFPINPASDFRYAGKKIGFFSRRIDDKVEVQSLDLSSFLPLNK